MKLLHKLLPVATIASITAVVAPVVTSCACSTSNGSWTRGQKYIPLSKKKGKTITGTEDDLTKAYESDIRANGIEHFSDDFVNYVSLVDTTVYGDKIMKFTVNKIKHQTTNVGEGSTTLGGGKYAFPISFTMTLTADAEITTSSNKKSNLSYNDSKMTFTNMPVKFMYFESAGTLGKEGDIVECCPVSSNELTTNPDWSIEMPALIHDNVADTFTLGASKKYSMESAEELMKDKALLDAFSDLLSFFTIFESNYYYNIELSKPGRK